MIDKAGILSGQLYITAGHCPFTDRYSRPACSACDEPVFLSSLLT